MKRFLSALLKYLVLITFFCFLVSGIFALCALLVSAVFLVLSWAHSTFGIGTVPVLLILGLAVLLALDEYR